MSQGSVFSPIEFISYIKDVFSVFFRNNVKHQSNADDKQEYLDVPANQLQNAQNTLQDCRVPEFVVPLNIGLHHS